MSIFGRKPKVDLDNESGSDDEFDFGELEGMGDDLSDDHDVPQDRKATIKNYVTEHYKMKFTDRGERKKLIKQALPSSYSGPVDLAYDLKDDYDSIKYEVSKEVEKLKSPLKKALKSYKPFVKFVPFAGKRALEWAEQEERSRYQEEEANQDEALVQSMLAEFTNPQVQEEREKEQLAERKLRQEEREDEADYREKSLSAQIQGVAASGNVVAELKKMTNYQDQVTFLYQKKSLEVGIRSLLEHRKQTDILRVYKDEALAELKEIHKNTGLPEVVKTNNSEVASQIFKERMIGKAATWFDGKLGTIRKRITTRIKDKLIETARDMGSSLTAMNEAVETAQEGGDSATSLAAKIGADQGLDWIWNRTTRRPLNWIRGKLQGNSKIAKFGRGANAIQKNLGGMLNTGLLEGSTGNKLLDKFVDWTGLRSAAVTRDDTMRQSLSKNLDTAAYMDQKFKQTVERVIPHWLSLIYKENHLMRMGWGFKEGDGTNGTIKHDEQVWDWDKETTTSKAELETKIMSKIFDKDKIQDYALALNEVVNFLSAGMLTKPTKEKLKSWVEKRKNESKAFDYYALLTNMQFFTKSQQQELAKVIQFGSGLSEDCLKEGVDTGQWQRARLMLWDHPKFTKWSNDFKPIAENYAGKSFFDLNKMQEDINADLGWVYEKLNLVKRGEDGQLSLNMDQVETTIKRFTRMEYKQEGHLVDSSEEETYTDGRGKTQKRAKLLDDKGRDFDEVISDMDQAKLDESVLKALMMMVDSQTIQDREDVDKNIRKRQGIKNIQYMTEEEAKKRKILDEHGNLIQNNASGGFIYDLDSYGGGGKTKKKYGKKAYKDTGLAKRYQQAKEAEYFAPEEFEEIKTGEITKGPIDQGIPSITHGGEFVSDAKTTQQNAELLELMNKLKASVVQPDGTVNPIYYKAFGFKDAKEMDASLAGAESSYKSKQTVRQIQKTGAWPYIESLFNSIDASLLTEEELKTLTDGKSDADGIIKLLIAIKEKQEKKSASQVAAGGISTAIKWFNKDRSGGKVKGKDLAEKTKQASKGLLKDMEKDLGKYSEEQAEPLFWEIAAYTDPKLISEETMLYFEDANVSWKDKVKKISMINYQHGDKADFVKKAMQGSAKKLATKTGLKLKNFINGSETDTANTDELKKIGKKLQDKSKATIDKVKNKLTVSTGKNVGLGLTFCWKMNDVSSIEVFTVAQMRQGLVYYFKPRGERVEGEGVPVIFIKTFSDIPTLEEAVDRDIIIRVFNDPEVLKTVDLKDHKSLKQVSTAKHFELTSYSKVWVDLNGKAIDLKSLIKEEKTESEKREFIGFNKTARDMLVDKAMDKMRVKKAYDLAMKLYDGSADAVDIYLLGSTESPRLTAVGFVNGDYIDKNTGRVCSSHHDITGPVVDKEGNVLLTLMEFDKGFCDKKGDPIEINVLKQYRNLAKTEAVKAYNKYGKKHVDRLSKGMLDLTEKWQNMFDSSAVNVFVGDDKEPRLTAAGFKNGDYLSFVTKKPLKGWRDIDGPVMNKEGVFIITQGDLENMPLVDDDGEQLLPPKLQTNLKRLTDVALRAVNFKGITKIGKKVLGKAKDWKNKGMVKFNDTFKKGLIYYTHPDVDGFGFAFTVDEVNDGKIFVLGVSSGVVINFKEMIEIATIGLNLKIFSLWRVEDLSILPKDKPIDSQLLQSFGRQIIAANSTEGKDFASWVDANGKSFEKEAWIKMFQGKTIKAEVKGLVSKVKGLFNKPKTTISVKESEVKSESVSLNTVTVKNTQAIYHKDPMTGAMVYLFTAQDMFDGKVYAVDPNTNGDNIDVESVQKITSFSYLHKGTILYRIDDLSIVEGKVITWSFLRAHAKELIKSSVNDGVWRDGEGKKLNAKKLKALESIEEADTGPVQKMKKAGFFKTLKNAFGINVNGEAKGDKDYLTNNNVVYYKDPKDRTLIAAFNLDEVKNGQVYIVDPKADKDQAVSKISSVDEIREGMFVYVVIDSSLIKEGMVITVKWLNKNAKLAVLGSANMGQWFDAKGKKLGKSFFSKGKDAAKAKVDGWKDRAKSMLSGAGDKVLGGIKSRIGSWQWKREQKEKDSWIGKLADAFNKGRNFGRKPDDGKKSWLSKLLAPLGMMIAGVGAAIKNSIGWLAKTAFSGLAKVAGWITKPITRALGFLGTRLMTAMKGAGGFLGRHKGKLLRGAAAVGGLALAADGMMGEAKVDAEGNPVLDENGNQMYDRDYTKVAGGLAMTALAIPGVAGAAATGAATAAGFLLANPIGWGVMAGAAVAYGGYKLFQWSKKKDAEKDYPITAFRMNQYGFSITDQASIEKLQQLEATLKPFTVIQGEKVNFKSDIDAQAVFSIFGLNFENGDQEKNKRFLTWFIGRFKPVYMSYVKAMNTLKKTTDISEIEKKLSPADAVTLLEKVHYKNQSETNPYNVLVSPFDDPAECDYDFEDVQKRYENTKEILTDKAGEMASSNKNGSLEDSRADEAAENETVIGGFKRGFKKAGVIGGLVGGSINALKMLGKKTGDIFNSITGSVKKGWTGLMDGISGWINEKWTNLKNMMKKIGDALANPLKFAKDLASGAIDGVLGDGTSEKVGQTVDTAVQSAKDTFGGYVDQASNAIGNVAQGLFGAGKGGWHRNKPKELESWIQKYATQYNLSPRDMLTMAWVESKGDPSVTNSLGYKGIFQFGPAAAKEVGLDYNTEALDGEKNTIAGMKLAAKNRDYFRKKVGRDPEAYELYLMHQQGAGGYSIIANAAAKGTQVPPNIQKNMNSNAPRKNMSAQEFMAHWKKKWEDSDAAVNGGTAPANPTTPATTPIAQNKPTTPNTSSSSGGSGGGGGSGSSGSGGGEAAPAQTSTQSNGGSNSSTQAQTYAKQAQELAKQAQAEKDPTKKKALADQSLAASKKAKELAAQAKATPTTTAPTAAKPATPASATVKPATSGASGALAKYLGMITPDLISKGKAHCSIAKNTTMKGMNSNVENLFYAMIGDAVGKGCPHVIIREGVRSLAEQQRLYNAYTAYKAGNGPKAPAAAKPGTSRHGFGFALDINPRPTVEWLVSKGYLEKWGFERNLLSTLGEWWHIEHKLLKPNGVPTPKIPKPVNDKNPSTTSTTSTTQQNSGTIGGRQSAINTGNAAINDVVNQGGGSNTGAVASAQQADSLAQSGVASILTKQLAVQTEMKSVLVEIRDHLIKGSDPKAKQELEQLKKPQSSEEIGAAIGGNIADLLANKFGLGKPVETPKPLPVISASK